MELAKSGFNIILMARNNEKLQVVAKEIRDTHKVSTKVLVYDFENLASEQSVEELGNLLEILD